MQVVILNNHLNGEKQERRREYQSLIYIMFFNELCSSGKFHIQGELTGNAFSGPPPWVTSSSDALWPNTGTYDSLHPHILRGSERIPEKVMLKQDTCKRQRRLVSRHFVSSCIFLAVEKLVLLCLCVCAHHSKLVPHIFNNLSSSGFDHYHFITSVLISKIQCSIDPIMMKKKFWIVLMVNICSDVNAKCCF